MKDLKHIKTIEDIDKIIKLKSKKLDTVKELSHVIQFEKSKYAIVKSNGATHLNRYHLIDTSNPSDPILYDNTPERIKSYINIRNISLDDIMGTELIYTKEEHPESTDYKTYDDVIDNISKTMDTLKELKKTINYEYCDYQLVKYKEGLFLRFILSKKETKEELTFGDKDRIKSYINRHKIDIDNIFGIELLDDKY